jgi:hypothetical protein
VDKKKAERLARQERKLHKQASTVIATSPTTPDPAPSDLDSKDDSHKPAEQEEVADATAELAFFLYTPYLSFAYPPRVLRLGTPAHSVPLALIHNSPFWRVWEIQLGDQIAAPGVLDPRGVVSWAHNGGDKRVLREDDKSLQGYKVRNWRLWGETGKNYVHSVAAARKAAAKGQGEEGWVDPDIGVGIGDGTVTVPARADEVVYMHWASPFSRDVRRYTFTYAGIAFEWKGTGTVKETRRCGMWLKYNHLKLVARIPIKGDGEPMKRGTKTKDEEGAKREVCLGKYQCSIATRKSGHLELFDAAIWRFVVEHFPASLEKVGLSDKIGGKVAGGVEIGEGELAERVGALKRTRLYAVIVATAMCMIIGDKQKRETLKKSVEILEAAGEGGG